MTVANFPNHPIMRALICIALSATTAAGQIPSAGDRDPNGRMYTKIVVTITDNSGAFGHPARDLQFLLVTENGDRVSVRTNDAGVASTWVSPANYRIVNPDPFVYDGKSYTWDLIRAVQPSSPILRLTQENATRTVVVTPATAAAPTSTIASTPRVVNVPSLSSGPSESSANSITQGFLIAPHFLGASLQTDDAEDDNPIESGGGFGLTLGYGFTRMLSAFLTVDAARIDIVDPDIEGTYTLANADLGLQFNFRDKTAKAIPYLQAAFSGRAAQTTVEGTDFEISGPAFTFGGGLNYHFQPKAALDVGLLYTAGKFDTVKVDGDEVPFDSFNANGARFRVGITLYPFSR